MKYLLPKNLHIKFFDIFKKLPKNFDLYKTIETAKNDIINYYKSPEYKDRLLRSGVIDENELNNIIRLKLDNINNTRIDHVFDPGNKSFGWSNIDYNGYPVVFINTAKANTAPLVKETLFHEVGGHAATNSYSHNPDIQSLQVMRQEIFNDPIYERIHQNNYALMPILKDSWKVFLDKGKNEFLKIADKEDIDLLNQSDEESIKNFIKYLTTEQETSARALASNIGDWTGDPLDWNKQQLYQFFTPESVEKLRRGVFGLIGSNFILQSGDPNLNNNKNEKTN